MFSKVIQGIQPLSEEIAAAAQARMDGFAKPVGSLGKLETYYVQLCSIQRTLDPNIEKKAVVVMASDHGVFEEGVAASPRAITRVQAINMTKGLTGVCALAQANGAEVVVVDMGIDGDVTGSNIIDKKILPAGSFNIAQGPAMERQHAIRAIEAGIDVANQMVNKGYGLLGIGEMGIANTTPTTAVVSVMTETSPERITGPGANLPKNKIEHKIAVIERAIVLNNPDTNDPIDVLSKVGGLDIAGMVGLILGAAYRKVPVVIDGFIALAAAILAQAIAPDCKGYMISSHNSQEPGARVASEYLNFEPPLSLGMRLGEGTGAALMFGILESAAQVNRQMATFTEGGFTNEEQKSKAYVRV